MRTIPLPPPPEIHRDCRDNLNNSGQNRRMKNESCSWFSVSNRLRGQRHEMRRCEWVSAGTALRPQESVHQRRAGLSLYEVSGWFWGKRSGGCRPGGRSETTANVPGCGWMPGQQWRLCAQFKVSEQWGTDREWTKWFGDILNHHNTKLASDKY